MAYEVEVAVPRSSDFALTAPAPAPAAGTGGGPGRVAAGVRALREEARGLG